LEVSYLKLKDLVNQLTIASVHGDLDIDITGININSRQIKPGDIFVCISGIPGLQEDRHLYIDEAIEAGAVALIVERDVHVKVPTIKVPNARYALAVIASHYYGYPSHDLKLVGVTGTNGKTTTSHMLEFILSFAGFLTGRMGSMGTKIGTTVQKSSLNTQDPHKLQSNLAKMKECSTDYCVMEVTSQGLHMGRVLGCEFRTSIFTNLTEDHLDYHGTMEDYLTAKGTLFSRMGNSFTAEQSKQQFAILNADDSASHVFSNLTAAQVITYGINYSADVMAEDIQLTAKGTTFRLLSFAGNVPISCKMVGAFNVYNALAAISAALVEQIPLHVIQQAMRDYRNVTGRMEIIDEDQDFVVIVDYAYTPDSLGNALSTLREVTYGRIITVFSCEDDHDGTSYPLMVDIANLYSDVIIVTSEHSSSESRDWRHAVTKAIELANPGDIIFIAGKDHKTEVHQILKDHNLLMQNLT
jgi:UDP-N-acetylmuramoyl-L-alanyl-D-glutamate--2,6-diaminopimelate ligase